MLIRNRSELIPVWMVERSIYPLFWISKHLSINLLDKIELYKNMSQKYIINPFTIRSNNKSIRSFYHHGKYKYQIFSKHNINYPYANLFDRTTLMFDKIYDNDFDDSFNAKKFKENMCLNCLNGYK